MNYQIKIAGMLDQSWADWLGSIKMDSEQLEDGSIITTLIVDADDQARIFGILDRIRDMNITLVAVSSSKMGGE
jgi:hypothetical protein